MTTTGASRSISNQINLLIIKIATPNIPDHAIKTVLANCGIHCIITVTLSAKSILQVIQLSAGVNIEELTMTSSAEAIELYKFILTTR